MELAEAVRVQTQAFEAINEVVRSSAADTTPMVVQLIPVIVGRLGGTLQMGTHSAEAAEKQSEVQGLLCGVLQVIVQKLSDSDAAKAGVVQYADPIMQALLSVLSCHKQSVHEEAMLAVVREGRGCMTRDRARAGATLRALPRPPPCMTPILLLPPVASPAGRADLCVRPRICKVHAELLPFPAAGLGTPPGARWWRRPPPPARVHACPDPLARLALLPRVRGTAQEWQVCVVTVGVLGDICRAVEDQIYPYCDPIMQTLLQNLQSPEVHRKVKPQILQAFGDLALATGDKFEVRACVSSGGACTRARAGSPRARCCRPDPLTAAATPPPP